MKSILLASITCLVLAVGGMAQAGDLLPRLMPRGCSLGIAQSPTVRGLKLGMPEADAARLVRQPFHAYTFDPVYLRKLYATPKRIGGFEGIELMSLTTFDGKLSRIEITYDVKWKSSAEFVENFTPKLGVPMEAWAFLGGQASMRCGEFDLTLDADLGELQLVDRTAEEEIVKLKAEFENDKKQAIRP